jgi:hypothetical protein
MDGRRPPLSPPPSWPGLDRLGLTQAIGGLALGLIAVFSSYNHLTIAGRNIPIPQQWGIPLIAALVATVFTGCVQYGAPLRRDAELASRSRLRAADERKSDRDRAEQRENEADRERNLADKERQRANRERNRAAVDEVGRRPWQENTKEKALSASIKRLCFPPESSSTPQTSIEPGFKPFLPS